MRNFLLTCLGALGLIVFVVGAVLPLRLPRERRSLGREGTATIIGFVLTGGALFLSQPKKRE